MEHQKIINLLDNTSNQLNLEHTIGLKLMMKQEEHTMLIGKLNLKLKC